MWTAVEKKPGDDEGQVAEGASLEGAGEEIMPDQSVAGAPDADGAEVQEGKQGPNARTGESDAAHRNDDYVEGEEERDPHVDRDLDN